MKIVLFFHHLLFCIVYLSTADTKMYPQEVNEYKDARVKTETKALESLNLKITDSDLPF